MPPLQVPIIFTYSLSKLCYMSRLKLISRHSETVTSAAVSGRSAVKADLDHIVGWTVLSHDYMLMRNFLAKYARFIKSCHGERRSAFWRLTSFAEDILLIGYGFTNGMAQFCKFGKRGRILFHQTTFD